MISRVVVELSQVLNVSYPDDLTLLINLLGDTIQA